MNDHAEDNDLRQQIARHQAFVDAVDGRREWTWDIWSMWIDEVKYLTPEGNNVARWAVSVLEGSLGPNFLRDRKAVALLETLGLWPLFSRSPIPWDYANLIQFAAQLEFLELANSGFIRQLRRNLTLEWWAHAQLQLDTACLGLLAGWQTQLEPTLVTGKPGDILFVRDQKHLFVEARLRYQPLAEQLSERFFYSMCLLRGYLELQYSVYITGKVGESLPTKKIAQLRQRLEEAAQTTNRDGSEQKVEDQERGMDLKVSKEVPPVGITLLESAPIPPPGLDLLSECLDEKDVEYQGAVPPWVRIEERAGLWQFSGLANLSAEQRLDFLSSYLHDTLISSLNLAGMILSPRLLLASQTPLTARRTRIEKASGMVVRCPIPGTRVRETIIIPREGHLTADAQLLASLFEKEDDLLNWLLAQVGQSPFNALVHDLYLDRDAPAPHEPMLWAET